MRSGVGKMHDEIGNSQGGGGLGQSRVHEVHEENDLREFAATCVLFELHSVTGVWVHEEHGMRSLRLDCFSLEHYWGTSMHILNC